MKYLIVILLSVMGAIGALLPTHSYAQVSADPDYAKDDSCIASPEGGDNLLQKTVQIAAGGSLLQLASQAADPSDEELTQITAYLNALSSLGIGALAAQTVVDGFVMDATYIPDLSTPSPHTNFSRQFDGTDCNTPVNKITFCYDPLIFIGFGERSRQFYNDLHGGTDTTVHVLNDKSQHCSSTDSPVTNGGGPADGSTTMYQVGDGETVFGYLGSIFMGKKIADKLCVQVYAGASGFITLGCRWMAPTAPPNPQVECYVGASCASAAALVSHSVLPVTSRVVQCVQDTLSKIFVDTTSCNNPDGSLRTNFYVGFQAGMRKTITAALTLYVIFFCIKVMLGQEVPKQAEVFMFIIKMALVVYFSMGDGLKNDLYPAFIKIGTGLSQVFFDSGGTAGLCHYASPGDATHAPDPAYSYGTSAVANNNAATGMPLWDAVDCRLGYYLMWYNTVPRLQADQVTRVPAGSQIESYNLVGMPAIISFFIPLLFSMQIFAAFGLLLFGVLFLFVTLFIVQTYLVALIGFTLVAYTAPLMVPMALFKFTRGFFDGWLRLLFTFTVQPIFLFAYLALMMTVFDKIYYANCPFTSVNYYAHYAPSLSLTQAGALNTLAACPNGGTGFCRPVIMFYLDDDALSSMSAADQATCKQTMGYALFKMEQHVFTFDMIFFQIRFPASVDTITFATRGIGPILMYCILFYFFTTLIVADIAGDLMNTFTVGSDKFAKMRPDKLIEAFNKKQSKKGGK